jgi:ABC-type lipoprotein export system ATPase subunit
MISLVPARIEATTLSFAYDERRPIFSGFSHTFSAGALTAVTGRSGCGKSTLLYLLGLLVRPEAGTITWDGYDVSRLRDDARSELRARSIGFVFQDALLDPARSVLANVMEGALFAGVDPAATRIRALRLLEQFDVQVPVDRRPGEISGGQAQRVALCRALVKDPSVILADEPTGNLDDESATVVSEALAVAAHDGAVVVLATHDPQLARRSDAVVVL